MAAIKVLFRIADSFPGFGPRLQRETGRAVEEIRRDGANRDADQINKTELRR
jgi:hypothetical protein